MYKHVVTRLKQIQGDSQYAFRTQNVNKLFNYIVHEINLPSGNNFIIRHAHFPDNIFTNENTTFHDGIFWPPIMVMLDNLVLLQTMLFSFILKRDYAFRWFRLNVGNLWVQQNEKLFVHVHRAIFARDLLHVFMYFATYRRFMYRNKRRPDFQNTRRKKHYLRCENRTNER